MHAQELVEKELELAEQEKLKLAEKEKEEYVSVGHTGRKMLAEAVSDAHLSAIAEKPSSKGDGKNQEPHDFSRGSVRWDGAQRAGDRELLAKR